MPSRILRRQKRRKSRTHRNLRQPASCQGQRGRSGAGGRRASHYQRKVEGDALVTRPQAGRALCEGAILRYVDPEGIEKWERAVKRERKKMRAALDQLLGR